MADSLHKRCFLLSLKGHNYECSTDNRRQDKDNHNGRNDYDSYGEYRIGVSICISTTVTYVYTLYTVYINTHNYNCTTIVLTFYNFNGLLTCSVMQFVLQQTIEKCTIQTIHKNIIVTVIEGILGL